MAVVGLPVEYLPAVVADKSAVLLALVLLAEPLPVAVVVLQEVPWW